MSSSGLFDLPAGQDEPTSPAQAPQALRGESQSLYRKYRPQTFGADDLVGQEHLVQTLRNAITLDRVAHAYLFCGPRGTGKTTTARLLAKAVNCLEPDIQQRPCNRCANCRAIATNATTDVIEIDAASNRGIDDIRELRERVKYAPTQLKTKFYIIDEAHQITGAAANAFLKTLEEPPEHTKFVLATTDPEELLQTIVSRCQRFDFRRISLDAMVGRLKTVVGAEGLTAEQEALEAIARNATGSLRDALGLLDQLSVYQEEQGDSGARTITADAVRALLGVSRNDRIEALASALAERDATTALTIVNDAVDAGEDPRQLNRQLVAYLRTLMFARAGSARDADETAKTIAAKFHLGELAGLAHLFSQVDYRIKHSAYAQLPLEIALVEATTRGDAAQPAATRPAPEAVRETDSAYSAVGVTPDQIAARPPTTRLADRLKGRQTPAEPAASQPAKVAPPPGITSAPTPAPARPVSAAPSMPTPAPARATSGNGSSNLTVDRLADLWSQIRLDVKTIDRRIEALLAATDPYDVDGQRVLLTTPYEFHCQRLNSDTERGIIADVIGRIVGEPVEISCYQRGQEPPKTVRSSAPVNPAPVPSSAPELESEPEPGHSPPPVTGGNLPDPLPPDDVATRARDRAPGHSRPSGISDERIKAAMSIFDAEPLDDSTLR